MMQGIGAFGSFGLLRNASKVGKNGSQGTRGSVCIIVFTLLEAIASDRWTVTLPSRFSSYSSTAGLAHSARVRAADNIFSAFPIAHHLLIRTRTLNRQASRHGATSTITNSVSLYAYAH